MQMIVAIVGSQAVDPASQGKRSAADSVSHSADGSTQISAVVLVFGNGVISKNHIKGTAEAGRYRKRLNGGPIIQHGNRHTCAIRKAVSRY
ncbi:hypothetical protein SDC9_162640 [bioreactor metagenome]|uniref:Uncharacterized protein n=1 Tax=bioreactor metagenome TaxID=1076179 RepID=A0A645FMY4_9ZZZZ